MNNSSLLKLVCSILVLSNLIACFQPNSKYSQKDKLEGIVAVSKTEAILIKSQSGSVKSLSLLNVTDSLQQIKWETLLPTNISFLSFDVEITNNLVFIPADKGENNRKLMILRLSDGKLIGNLERGNDWTCLNKKELFLKENGQFKLYDIE